ncbi:hypothetical protein GCM10010497_24080 [Streptomyces cinereoruber]|uniref:DUF2092 domain-containing protein n=1 Tax=Streptomyces cinereoruber TaxID=67260 RepID=A0AAV4KFK6_9ACTN|nr:hypothetical protein [Streptomyces cinereoruber]MBB4162411.1 hypothetical protein [Streptomyces cinereoruber]NIH63944.1 hypothetical protein [Streptomyces cinereoruber]GGR20914.1 hypothetical protein GCM10010497_24080 [Streptomyces cinereoruber]
MGDRTYKETTIAAIRKTLTATAVIGAVLVGSAACGTVEQLSAGQKLDKAFEKLGKEKSISFELDLDVDAETLKLMDASSDPEPGEEIPDEAAELISGLKVSVTVESKKPIADSEGKDFVGTAVKVSSPDGDLLEYRTVGDRTYVRSDVKTLSKTMGAPLPTADQLPPGAEGLKKALEGKWVMFDTKAMEEAGRETGQEPSAVPSPAPTLDAGAQKKLAKALREVIAREVEFKTTGGEDGTEHITAAAPFRTLAGELLGEIRPLVKGLPPGVDLPSDKDLKDVPDAKVAAHFTLKNGELAEVHVDLGKLAENAEVKKFGLVLKTSGGVKPEAPAGATELDLEEIMSGFAGVMMPEEGLGEDGFDESGLGEDEFPDESLADDAA